MGQFATGLATKSRLKSQLRFRERGQTFGTLNRKDTGKYDQKNKNRLESENESDDIRQTQTNKQKINISQKKGERR